MRLAFISLFNDSEDYVTKYLHNMLGNRAPLYAHVVGTTSAPEVILTVGEDQNSMSVHPLLHFFDGFHRNKESDGQTSKEMMLSKETMLSCIKSIMLSLSNSITVAEF